MWMTTSSVEWIIGVVNREQTGANPNFYFALESTLAIGQNNNKASSICALGAKAQMEISIFVFGQPVSW